MLHILYIKSRRTGPGPWAAPQALANQADTKPGPAWPVAPTPPTHHPGSPTTPAPPRTSMYKKCSSSSSHEALGVPSTCKYCVETLV